MPKVVAELKITPIGTGSASLSTYIAHASKVLNKTKVKCSLGANGTTLEGELKDILSAVEKAHNSMFQLGIKRVGTLLSIDDRRDKKMTASSKLKSVKKKLRKR